MTDDLFSMHTTNNKTKQKSNKHTKNEPKNSTVEKENRIRTNKQTGMRVVGGGGEGGGTDDLFVIASEFVWILRFCFCFCLFVPPGTSCGAFIRKHASVITISLAARLS